jgi:dynein heavy chain
VSLLTLVTKQGDVSGVIDVARAASLLAQWREIDIHITEAANEAKDNVKYLSTLERFFEALNGKEPAAVVDSLPALLNALKMIHTIARYFGTTDRMTKLFMKITNQMITCCKLSIVGKASSDMIWGMEPAALLAKIELCLQLNEEYQDNFRKTKEALVISPKSRQFDFSEVQIFGKFDLFCRRLIKLMDMFSTMQQFRALAAEKFEGLDTLLASYNEVVRALRLRGHDLLDFHNNHFDRDFVIFSAQLNELEGSLQIYIDRSFEHVGGIDKSLELLKRYQRVLTRETIRRDLDSKMSVIFHNYGLELNEVEAVYEKQKADPPLARNMTPIAGNILWVRHLLRRIEDPMDNFRNNTSLLSSRESKKIIKTYNKVARTLTAFEYLWYEAWCSSLDAARAGLQATLIIKHPETGKLFVNFDRDILQLIRESKCLAKLGIKIPEEARLVLLQEQNFKMYYDDLRYALSEYDRIAALINPVTKEVLKPHLGLMEHKLRPGMITLTWTSMNIEQYKVSIMAGLSQLEELITKINDIVENRIQKKLIEISKKLIVDMPDDRSVALDEFVMMQETAVKTKTSALASKNMEIESAVDDLVRLVSLNSGESGGVSKNFQEELQKVHGHYNSLTYQAMRSCIKRSLNALKSRAAHRSSSLNQNPFFEVDVQLSVPSVRLSPSLDDIQKAINRASVAVIGSAAQMWLWGQSAVIESDRKSFFEYSGGDMEILKTVLLLTGALQGTRNIVHEYLKKFSRYDWLWKDDKELTYKRFESKNPSLDDFEQQLKNFLRVEEEIASIEPVHYIGAIILVTNNIKHQLRNECSLWKVLFSNKLHQRARESAFQQHEYIHFTKTRLSLEVDELESLRYKMSLLAEIREKESTIITQLNPILDLYTMLEKYIPEGIIDKDEVEQKNSMLSNWRKLVEYADEVTSGLAAIQGVHKKKLIADIR